MFRALVDDEPVEGEALYWNASQMVLLARDGQLHSFDPRTARAGKKTAPRFSPYSFTEMKQALRDEFGPGFTVTSTGRYLVVHPPGDAGEWGQRFEGLYRQFMQYFRVRGFEVKDSKVPLVAVILPTRRDYQERASASGVQITANTLGHYDPRTNRVLMFDQSLGADDENWAATAATIVHEATHQTAYNVGLHSRLATTPRWLVEGLAMMFEVRGVNGTVPSGERASRVHRPRLADFRHYAEAQGTKGCLGELVASDQAFDQTPERGYANAWALTFFLSETRPRQYEEYLKLTAARPPLVGYSTRERVRDFAKVFGDDLPQLEAEFLRWVGKL